MCKEYKWSSISCLKVLYIKNLINNMAIRRSVLLPQKVKKARRATKARDI